MNELPAKRQVTRAPTHPGFVAADAAPALSCLTPLLQDVFRFVPAMLRLGQHLGLA